MRRTSCSACGCEDLRVILDLGSSPIADAYLTHSYDTVNTYPLELAVCGKCQLVQLLEVVDARVLFGTGYSFYTSASPPLSAYHKRYARDVLDAYGDLAQRLTVEVGCNDGDLLQHFDAAGCRTRGIDPSGGPVDVARARGLTVCREGLTTELARVVRDEHGPAGVVIANHVLAHVESVADVLSGISTMLADDGVALIEVQYLPDLLVNNAFDLVYHEHRNFFSLNTLEGAAARWDLHVIDARLTDRQGGSLRVTLSKTPRVLASANVEKIRTSERWLDGVDAYGGLQGRVERIRSRMWDLLDAERAAGRDLAGYGAPAKATTLLNFCGVDHATLQHVVDTTEAKQGRYIPGTGIPIVSPADAPSVDTYLLLSWNYAAQIMRDNPGMPSIRWIVPIPAPVLL